MSKKNSQGIVIGTKDEVLWTRVRDVQLKRVAELETELIICKEVLKLAKNKILLEKRK